MKFERVITVAILCLAAGAPLAQAESTEELAQKYINMPQVQEMMTEMLSADTAIAQIQTMMGPNTSLDDEQKAEIGKLVSDKFAEIRPDLESAMESAAATSFTEEEIQALIDFYSSPQGAAVMKKMPKYQAAAMSKVGPKMQGMMLSLVPEIQKIMTRKK